MSFVNKSIAVAPSSAGTKAYDSLFNVYNFKPSKLVKTRAALAKAETGLGTARIVCGIDSITAGEGGGDLSTKSWPAILRNMFEASGVPIRSYGPTATIQGDSGSDPRWAYTGTWAKWTTDGVSSRNMIFWSNASNSTAQYTSTDAGDRITLWYLDGHGSFTVSIDGATAVTVPGTGTLNAFNTYSVTGLSQSVHTIKVTCTGNETYLLAAQVANGTTGLEITNLGFGGATLADWYDANNTWSAVNFAVQWGANLAIIDGGGNEALQGQPASTTVTNLTTVVNQLLAAGIEVLLVVDNPFGGSSAPSLTAYRDAVYSVATSLDVPLVDMMDRWGSYATANAAGLMYNNVHPNYAGYRDYSHSLFSVIKSAGSIKTAAQTVQATPAGLSLSGVSTQTSNYTFGLADAGKQVEANASTQLTFTIPANASVNFPVGSVIQLCEIGTGSIVVAPSNGTTLLSSGGLGLTSQYATAQLVQRATDVWVLSGNTGTVTATTTETWPGTTGTAWPGQWTATQTSGAGGAATQQGSNVGRINAGTTASGGTYREYLSGMANQGATNLKVSFVVGAQNNMQFNFGICCDNNGLSVNPAYMPQNGYTMNVNINTTAASSTFDCWKMLNNNYQSLGSPVTKTITAGTKYSIRILRANTTISYRMWDASLAEPSTWDLQFNDTATQPIGKVLMSVQNSSTTTGNYVDFSALAVSLT